MHRTSGQAALSFVFIIGGIMIAIAVTLAVLALSFLSSGFGYQSALRAQAAATAGAEDAVQQLVRSPSYAGSTITVGSDSATITVTPDSPVSGQYTIVSISTVSSVLRKVQVVVAINVTTGEVTVLSWSLIT